MEAQGVLAQFAAKTVDPASQKKDELGQDDFMRLLVTQLKNQDPTKPMDNFEFLSQVAQFGMVSGIQESQQSLNRMVDSLSSSRVLQATELVGRKVVADSNIAELVDGRGMSGVVDLPASAANIEIQITNPAGELQHTVVLGPSGGGRVEFSWDGLNAAGEPAPPGFYRVSGSATIRGATEAVPTYAASSVRSVSVATGGAEIHLHLDNGETISSADVREFM